jgi:hypothetical protein
MRKLMALGLASFLAACAGGAGQGQGDSITIPSGVWAQFQKYKDGLNGSGDQYFAASSDGGYASNSDKDQVVKDCQQYAKSTCVLFAHNDEILVPYHVRN